MNWIELLTTLISALFGGGLVALVTIKAKKDKATAETDKVEMDNFRTGTKILVESIVTPLKQELSNVRSELVDTKKELVETRKELVKTQKELADTKKELADTQREVYRMRKAMRKITDCAHAEICPVRKEMRNIEQQKQE